MHSDKQTSKTDTDKENLVMERHSGIGSNAHLAGTESSEVLGGLWNDVVVKLHH